MNTKYRDLFVKYLLDDCKYPNEAIHANTYKYAGKEYGRVEVLSEGHFIQAFVLMSSEHCQKLDKFPFYRTYYQWNDFGYLTPPACNVAVYNNETQEWEFHSSSDLRHELTSPTLLDYDAALERFNKRWDFAGNRVLWKIVRNRSFISLSLASLYLVAYLLSNNGLLNCIEIPLNTAVVSVLIVIMILIILPPLIPYFKSITIHGLEFEFN